MSTDRDKIVMEIAECLEEWATLWTHSSWHDRDGNVVLPNHIDLEALQPLAMRLKLLKQTLEKIIKESDDGIHPEED